EFDELEAHQSHRVVEPDRSWLRLLCRASRGHAPSTSTRSGVPPCGYASAAYRSNQSILAPLPWFPQNLSPLYAKGAQAKRLGLPMNFQQLRSVRETVRCGFNLTEVASVLHTSQPGISRQIRELEDELGIEIFARAGKRLTGLTPPGEAVLPIVERLLLDANNLKRAGAEFAAQASGPLSIATTHTQARYALPAVVRDF